MGFPRRLILCGVLLLALGMCPPARGQTWGTVDVRLLLIIHPDMQAYDYASHRFFRPRSPGMASATLRRELETARARSQSAAAVLTAERARLRSERAARLLDPAGAVWRRETLPGGGSGTSADAAADERLRSVEADLAEARAIAWAPLYLSPKETRDRLDRIRLDLLQTVREVASEEKIDAVIDASLGQVPGSDSLPPDAAEGPPTPETGVDVAQAALLPQILRPGTVPPAAPQAEEGDASGESFPQAHAAFGDLFVRTDLMRRLLRDSLRSGAGIPARPTGGLFLLGGRDLTGAVARKLLARPALSEPVRNRLLEAVREFLGPDRDQGRVGESRSKAR